MPPEDTSPDDTPADDSPIDDTPIDNSRPDSGRPDSGRPDDSGTGAEPVVDSAVESPGGTDLEAVAEELYGLRPDEFVDGRDDAVARAREAGDRDLARAIGRLRRPTRAAWLANLLVRKRPQQLKSLLGLAAGLADAQRTLDGTALRQLSAQRHRLVRALADEAARLAAARHDPVGDGLLRDVGGILEAALADPAVADEVRSGRLTRTVSYTGFGPASDPDAVPAPPRRDPPAPTPGPELDDREAVDGGGAQRERAERERAERERELDSATEQEAEARERAEADEAVRDDAIAARDDARRELDELTARLDVERERERAATAAAREAEGAAKASAREAGAAAARTARARVRLDDLDVRTRPDRS